MMVIVMIVSIVYLEHRSFMVIYGHIMPYLVISLIISLKNHESPCNLVFFGFPPKAIPKNDKRSEALWMSRPGS